jgi:NADPH:quinone reductase-like Zn-dependent oxidoreductase
VLGGYFSGEIAAVGARVTKFRPGDHVFGATQLTLGAYGEYMCLPDHYTVVPKPSNTTFEEAAAVPLGGLNAIHFARMAHIREGETVLVNGAGGSIGTFAVQIAKSMGAEVTAVDSAIKGDMLRRIGADRFIDYAKEDFTQTDQKYDVIFNMVAKSSYPRCFATLNPQGRYVTANPRLSVMLWSVYASWFADKKVGYTLAGETEEELLALKQMIEDGQITPTVDRVYSMERAAEAHRRVETEARLGSVVISLD